MVVSLSAQGLEEPRGALYFILGKGKKTHFIGRGQWGKGEILYGAER